MKTCFKCGKSKERSQFYTHSAMADGLLGKCKECAKIDVKLAYRSAGGRKEYEQRRSKRVERKRAAAIYQKQAIERNPQKHRARVTVANAVRDKRLNKEPCAVCGDKKSEAHHENYEKPLEVIWLCLKHHRMKHGALVIT